MPRVWQALRNGDWLTRERIRLIAAAVLCVGRRLCFLVVDRARRRRPPRPAVGYRFLQRLCGRHLCARRQAGCSVRSAASVCARAGTVRQGDAVLRLALSAVFLFVAAALAILPYGVALDGLAGVDAAALSADDPRDRFSFPRLRGEGRDEGASPPGSAQRPLTLLRFAQSTSPPAGRGDILLLALAFPAVLVNLGHGQNGFLTAALLGGALVVLDRRPIVAGILFGLLVYKPQFGLMIPLALVAGGHWRTVCGRRGDRRAA